MTISIYEEWLLFVALASAVCSIKNPRGLAWVFAITADIIASTAYWKNGLPYAEAFTFTCDGLVCLGIYRFGKYRWEMWVWRVFMASFLWSMIYLAIRAYTTTLIDQDTYSSGLEFANYVAFLLIGGISASQLLGPHRVVDFFEPWRRRFPAFVSPIFHEDGTHQARRARS